MTPRKPGKPTLTREQIVRAALELIDETGVEGHSMRQLGDRLGVDASSLYYHIPSQAALFDLIVDAVMAEMPVTPVPEDADPVETFVQAGKMWFDAMMRHPNAMPLIAVRPLRTPAAVRPVDELLGVLFRLGMSSSEAIAVVDGFGWLVLGAAQAHAAQFAGSEYVAESGDERLSELPADRFPNVARLMTEGIHITPAEKFEATLRGFVRGMLAEYLD